VTGEQQMNIKPFCPFFEAPTLRARGAADGGDGTVTLLGDDIDPPRHGRGKEIL